MDARQRLIEELRAHALVIGEVVLTSGRVAQYYVDAKRAVLRPAGFAAMAELVAARAGAWGATAVGGLTMGADAPACAALEVNPATIPVRTTPFPSAPRVLPSLDISRSPSRAFRNSRSMSRERSWRSGHD